MFCSKCGNKIADGAKFCSVCGARAVSTGLEPSADHPVSNRAPYTESNRDSNSNRSSSLDLDWGNEDKHKTRNSSTMAFDWSSVVEERKPRKKVPQNVRSPWDSSDDYDSFSSGHSSRPAARSKQTPPRSASYREPAAFREAERKISLEEELFGKEQAPKERSRTMNFIDVLKQEKDNEAREEYERLRYREPGSQPIPPTAHPARRESVLPESQRERNQGYTDPETDLFSDFSDETPKQRSFEDQLASIRTERRNAHQRTMHTEMQQPEEDSYAAFDKMLNGMKSEYEEPQSFEAPRRSGRATGAYDTAYGRDNGSGMFEAEPTVQAPASRTAAPGRNTMYRDYESSFQSIDDAMEDDFADVRLNNFEEKMSPAPSRSARRSAGRMQRNPQDRASARENDYFFGEDDDFTLNTREMDEGDSVSADDVDLFAPTDTPHSAAISDSYAPETAPTVSTNTEDDGDFDAFDEYLDYVAPRRTSRTSSRRARTVALEEEEDDWFDSADELDDESFTENVTLHVREEEPEALAAHGVTPVVAPAAAEVSVATGAKSDAGAAPTVPTETASSVAPAEPTLEPDELADDSKSSMQAEIAALQKQLEMLLKAQSGGNVESVSAEESVTAEEPIETESAAADESVAPAVPVVEPTPIETSEPEVDTATEATLETHSFADDDQLDLDKELAQLGFYLGDDDSDEPAENDSVFTSDDIDVDALGGDTVVLPADELTGETEEVMSLESLESDIFGNADEEEDPEATRKIDKFYTLYRKNEEFQKLLDEEYSKLQGEDFDDEVDNSVNDILGYDDSEEEEYEEEYEEGEDDSFVMQNGNAAAVSQQQAVLNVPSEGSKPMSKKEAKAAKKAAKAAKKEALSAVAPEDEIDEKGGNILTVIAIVVAVLLVVLLAIILILNFAPESGIAQTLNEVIGNYTNFFAETGASDSLM